MLIRAVMAGAARYLWCGWAKTAVSIIAKQDQSRQLRFGNVYARDYRRWITKAQSRFG